MFIRREVNVAVRRCSFIAALLLSAAFVAAQQPPQDKYPLIFPVYVDPICPVNSFSRSGVPNATGELRVMYYPQAKQARIKRPEALHLYVGFNYPRMSNNSADISFAQYDDHWEAIVPLQKTHTGYAIFHIKDEKSGAVDDNDGKFWDVIFCTPLGDRDLNSILRQAESYTGVTWPMGIHRTKDYNKAVSLLEGYLSSDPLASKHSFAYEYLWNYKAARDGGDAKAWASVAGEIDKYIQSHLDEWQSVRSIGNYVVRNQDKLPPAFVDRVIPQIDALNKDSKNPLKAQLMYTRALRMQDRKQRMAAMDEFIKSYPDAVEVVFALDSKFYDFAAQRDVAGAEAAFAAAMKSRETHKDQLRGSINDHNLYLTLAELYIENGVKLDEALKLADQSRDVMKAETSEPGILVAPEVLGSMDAQIADTKARAYMAMKKSQDAAQQAQKALEQHKSSSTYLVLAQAQAAAGEKQKTLDAYFEALLLPSNNDTKIAAELKDYYLKQGLGDEVQLQAELDKRRQERFKSANYTPTLTDKPAPAFEFTSVSGEKFPASVLATKTVVINFWAPG